MSEFKAPAPRKPAAGGGAGGLSNNDFRAILATPRAGGRAQPNLPAGKVTLGRSDSDDQGGHVDNPAMKAVKKKKKWQPKKADDEAEEEDQGPQYRDRAKERREGKIMDYDNTTADMAAVLEGPSLDVSKISVEESKYLGGDVEHTHLVKGLDYALLHKVRGDQESEQAEKNEDGSTEKGRAESNKATMRFVTPMGKAVHRALMDEMAPRVPVDSFLPGRMAFLYSFEEDELGNPPPDAPTTLRRSKADCPKLPPTLLGGIDRPLLERIATVMSYVQLAPGGKKTKMKKKDRSKILGEYAVAAPGQPSLSQPLKPAAPIAAPAAVVSDDEDIFDDAGRDYVCDVDKGKADSEAAPNKDGSGGYFDNKDDMDDLPPLQGPAMPPPGGAQMSYNFADDDGDVDMEVDDEPVPPPPPDAEDGSNAAAELPRSGEDRTKRKETAKKQELKGFADEAYAECFPEFQGMGAEVADSDEETDKMDLGRQGAKVKTRYDFSTEEEYNQYKATQEANPKAAFQFGVKREDGRRRNPGAAGKKNQDSQMNSDLGKIKSILKEKGHKKDMVAFERPADEVAATPKRRKRV